jgi:hypothetical protein
MASFIPIGPKIEMQIGSIQFLILNCQFAIMVALMCVKVEVLLY